jgi:hypothetical protein
MSSDVAPEVLDWVTRFAAATGTEAPTAEEIDQLLAVAGVAAHASQRQAAPLTTWLAGRAGISPAEALRLARTFAPDEEPA